MCGWGRRFVDWGLQNQYNEAGEEILPRPKGDEVDEERFEAWREGRTGFPCVGLPAYPSRRSLS
jgi:cryptochrome